MQDISGNLGIFDGLESELVYTDPQDFSIDNRSKPIFSHHKLTCFEYADGVNKVDGYDLTDLDMYYAKVSNAYNTGSGSPNRNIDSKYPLNPDALQEGDLNLRLLDFLSRSNSNFFY